MVAKRFKSLLVAAFSLGIIFFSNSTFAQDSTHAGAQQHPTEEGHGKEEKFDVTKTILPNTSAITTAGIYGVILPFLYR